MRSNYVGGHQIPFFTLSAQDSDKRFREAALTLGKIIRIEKLPSK